MIKILHLFYIPACWHIVFLMLYEKLDIVDWKISHIKERLENKPYQRKKNRALEKVIFSKVPGIDSNLRIKSTSHCVFSDATKLNLMEEKYCKTYLIYSTTLLHNKKIRQYYSKIFPENFKNIAKYDWCVLLSSLVFYFISQPNLKALDAPCLESTKNINFTLENLKG
ncbi:hypothetical protein Avbf_15769, partial [Armadillidium vulgare]